MILFITCVFLDVEKFITVLGTCLQMDSRISKVYML